MGLARGGSIPLDRTIPCYQAQRSISAVWLRINALTDTRRFSKRVARIKQPGIGCLMRASSRQGEEMLFSRRRSVAVGGEGRHLRAPTHVGVRDFAMTRTADVGLDHCPG